MAEHRVEGDQALEPVIAQLILKHVIDVDEHEAHELAQAVAAHAAECEAVAHQIPDIGAMVPGQAGWRHLLEGREQRGIADEIGPERRPGFPVGGGERAVDGFTEGAAEDEMITASRERRAGDVLFCPFQPVGAQVEGGLEAGVDTC